MKITEAKPHLEFQSIKRVSIRSSDLMDVLRMLRMKATTLGTQQSSSDTITGKILE